eukprot:TRINITY_DN12176_c1_g1_i1.p1 TRINITY_DN12176_c1_g1~~TRINITY_DN12176_c1_g1_i1.p1  ORF type:complete len:592 (+),score=170.99 TRINITY_DN12176_c1_g1_i1:72-1778(+)
MPALLRPLHVVVLCTAVCTTWQQAPGPDAPWAPHTGYRDGACSGGVLETICPPDLDGLDHCNEECIAEPRCAGFDFNSDTACCTLRDGCDGEPLHSPADTSRAVRSTAYGTSLLDVDCRGADIPRRGGGYMKQCGILLTQCEELCRATPECNAFTYNYEGDIGPGGKWDDRCCWLKQSCNAQPMPGKLSLVLPPSPRGEPSREEEEVPVSQAKPQQPRHSYGPVQLAELLLEGADILSCDTAWQSTSPAGEGVAQLSDGDLSTKWVDFTHSPVECEVDRIPTAYSFVTANDAPERDPVEWSLFTSPDGVTWSPVSHEDRDGLTEERHHKLPWIAIAVPPGTRYVRLEVGRLRSEPGAPITSEMLPGTRVVEDIACEGNDLVYGGAVQRACGVPEHLCHGVCSRLLHCALYWFEEAKQCCALKTACTDHRRLAGRRAVVVRHAVSNAYYLETQGIRNPLRSAESHLKSVLAQTVFQTPTEGKAKGDAISLEAALDALSAVYGEDDVSAALEEWMEEQARAAEAGQGEEEKEKEEEGGAEAVLPFFVTPQPRLVRPYWLVEKELEPPQRQ